MCVVHNLPGTPRQCTARYLPRIATILGPIQISLIRLASFAKGSNKKPLLLSEKGQAPKGSSRLGLLWWGWKKLLLPGPSAIMSNVESCQEGIGEKPPCL